MKKILLITFLLSAIAFAVPKMSISEDSFDFGYIPQTAKVSHTFWIYSVGDDSLKILKVKPG